MSGRERGGLWERRTLALSQPPGAAPVNRTTHPGDEDRPSSSMSSLAP